jgi:hypothetical protein
MIVDGRNRNCFLFLPVLKATADAEFSRQAVGGE